jgi:3-oxoacyl-[acyl-carrier protein] reductase
MEAIGVSLQWLFMEFGIRGKTAAIAAGTAGLGYATAQALVQEGVRVAICGRDESRLYRAVSELGDDAVGVLCDVSTADGARTFVTSARQALGPIDILITNGGGPPAGDFAHTDESEYAKAVEKNLLSVVAMCYAAVPEMCERKWGRVVAITSVAVRQPVPNLILSNTARAGATGFLKTLAREVAVHGVTVNSVQPGMHRTDRITQLYGENIASATAGIPAGVLGEASDFGAVTAFLCSDQAKFVTGVQLHVDGGAYAGLL